VQDPPIDEATTTEPTLLRRVLRRMHPPSFSSPLGGPEDDEASPKSTSDRPPIPTMTPSSGEVYTTPLPTLSMIVLSITMLGEFLCANVSTPFLLFMVKGFAGINGEAEVAFWTGIIVSTFFLTQFITSLLWATVAEKHGRRAVLIISLLGSALTCLIFGTATNLQQAITIRLLQGIFGGAVGVARGSITFITDPSNEGRAYAILGFCWGLGGVAGAIIGGAFESPVKKWPGVFQNYPLFATYPYLLPCAIAALITLIGAFLACFLGRDGGPREGAIRLAPEKVDAHPPIAEEESTLPSPPLDASDRRPSFVMSIRRSLLGQRGAEVSTTGLGSPSAVPMASAGPRLERTRTFSSRANGSAYGYSGGYRHRLASNATLNLRKGSIASSPRWRRGSNVDSIRGGGAEEGNDLNFAQRLLMANENAVTNIADLWVAAAMNADNNEDPFESDTEAGSDGEPDSGEQEQVGEEEDVAGTSRTRGRRSTPHAPPAPLHLVPSRSSTLGMPPLSSRQPSYPRRSPLRRTSASVLRSQYGSPTTARRFSVSPSIFAHSGVRTPLAVLDAQQQLENLSVEPLQPISESRPLAMEPEDVESLVEKQPTLASQIPVLIIIQYGMLALHTTTHDQVFMSYLVSDYNAGGLNLNAGHFAQLSKIVSYRFDTM